MENIEVDEEVVRHRLSTEAMMMVLMGLAWSCLTESRLGARSPMHGLKWVLRASIPVGPSV